MASPSLQPLFKPQICINFAKMRFRMSKSSIFIFLVHNDFRKIITRWVKPMISGWHLAWIIPVAAIIGIVVEAILIAGDDDK